MGMQVKNLDEARESFAVLDTASALQTAVMDLGPGEASGAKTNEHAGSEQVLFVVSGELRAEIGAETRTMRRGDSVIVPKGVAHKFTNTGTSTARTFNVYSPPAY